MANSFQDHGIQIPLKNNKIVHVFRDDMEQNVDGVLKLLKVEVPALAVWANFAIQYFQLGNNDAALDVLKEADQVAKTQQIKNTEAERTEARKGKALLVITHGSYYTEQYRKSKEENLSSDVVEDYFNKANQCFGEAANLLQDEMSALETDSELIWIAKGYLALYANTGTSNYRSARENFNAAMDVTQGQSYAANLGLGAIQFLQGDFKHASKCYSKILSNYPHCAPDVRVCLGHCYLKMSNLEMAKKCYQRALTLDVNNAHALTALAMMEMDNERGAKDAHRVKKNVTKMFNAHRQNPNLAATLNGLADHFFKKMRYNKVIELCSRSVERTANVEVKGQAYLLMARTYHKENNFEQASKFYKLARNNFKSNQELLFNPALQMGLGQMALRNKDMKNALSYFEKGLAKNPSCKELLLVLGSIYANKSSLKKSAAAIKYLQKVIELDNVDYEARLELGNLYRSQGSDASKKEALKLYKRSIKAMTEVHGKKPTPDLLNNVAVLYQKLGDFKNARKEFIKALKLSKKDSDSDNNNSSSSNDDDNEIFIDLLKEGSSNYLYEKSNITLTFNVALYLEQTGDRIRAERLHLGIVKHFPGYGESYVCLGQIYRERNMHTEAVEYLKKAVSKFYSPEPIKR